MTEHIISTPHPSDGHRFTNSSASLGFCGICRRTPAEHRNVGSRVPARLMHDIDLEAIRTRKARPNTWLQGQPTLLITEEERDALFDHLDAITAKLPPAPHSGIRPTNQPGRLP